jgi:hypothetical protein
LLGLAVCDDGFELAGGRGEVGGCGRVYGLVGAVVGELGLLGAEVIEAGVQARDALFATLGGEPALLEGLEVALGRAFDTGDLGGDRATLLIERWSLALRLLLGGAEGVVDERAVAVDAVSWRRTEVSSFSRETRSPWQALGPYFWRAVQA